VNHRDRFAELLSQIARDITRRQTSEVCCGDLTLEQFQTLRRIDGSALATIGSLAQDSSVDLSTMSRNVTVLERNGYLLRSRSAEDGRIVQVKLTPKGRRALESLQCDERDVLKDVYERLSVTEQPKVIRALELLQGCLATIGTTEGACCSPAVRRSGA
jgi:DNA-binding MarR family transcriptional regulator